MSSPGEKILRGYLNSEKERIVRILIAGDRTWLAVKGLTSGATRLEFEYEIPVSAGRQMFDELCERPILEKTRYRVPAGNHTQERMGCYIYTISY